MTRIKNIFGKNLFASVFAIVLLAVGAFYFTLKWPGGIFSLGKNQVIELHEDGFYPQEIIINQGDTVTFRSKLGRYFWPASDIHPTHEIYPEFDRKEPTAPNESWKFRFDKIGEWKFHDHLAPYFTGKITVRGKEQSRSQSHCDSNGASVPCWQEKLVKTLNEKGLSSTFDLFAELYSKEPGFKRQCHFLTHNIGIASYKLFLKDKDSVLSPKTAFCANGFYHGFMEAFLTTGHTPQEASAFCSYVGQKLSKDTPDAELQCYHGIGHGLMDSVVYKKNNQGDEERLVAPALALCEETSRETNKLYRCASGVFNSIANFYISGEHGLKVNEKNPLWLCDEQPDKFKESCYGNMNIMIVKFAQSDFSKAAAYIDELIPSDTYAVSAIRYLGATAAISIDNMDDGVRACRKLRGSLYKPCIEGLVHGFLEHGTPGVEYKDAIKFCKSEILTSKERDYCFHYTLADLNGWYSKEKSAEICGSLEEKYRKYCNT